MCPFLPKIDTEQSCLGVNGVGSDQPSGMLAAPSFSLVRGTMTLISIIFFIRMNQSLPNAATWTHVQQPVKYLAQISRDTLPMDQLQLTEGIWCWVVWLHGDYRTEGNKSP